MTNYAPVQYKKILIIGSNSFSGSNMINFLLKKDFSIIGISRSKEPFNIFLPYSTNTNFNFTFKKLDLNKDINKIINLIKKFKPRYIINYAAQSMVTESFDNSEQWYKTNILSQIKLFNFLIQYKYLKKYIHFTTPEVYGNTNKWIKENDNFKPSTPYAISRAACDSHLMTLYNNFNFPVIFTRAANVYGAGQQLYRIIPQTIINARLKKKLLLEGGGKSIRSFIHIDDVSDAVFKILNKGKNGSSYHISTNKSISIKNLVLKIYKIMNIDFKKLVKITPERRGKDYAYLLNTSKIRKTLKWKDKISLEKGILDTISWVDKNIKIIKKKSTKYKHKA